MKAHLLNLVVVTCALLGNVCWAVEEPNDLVGVCSAYSGITVMDPNSACPYWDWAWDRDGSDGGYLTVYLDACQILAYDVNSIPQSTPAPVSIDVQKDDVMIVWDEDISHGDDPQFKAFTFINAGGIEDPNGYIADPNCSYVKVVTTDHYTNWMIYCMLENGTAIVTSTGCNEHDVIHLYRNQIDFDKVDDVNDLDCRSPEEEITYTICWDNEGLYTFENAYIIDWLPDGVDYARAGWTYDFDPNLILIPPDPAYQAGTHAYLWEIGTIEPGDANCVELTVMVNDGAQPGMLLHNMAELISGDSIIARAFENTRVCCWGYPNVIYVDQTATGGFNSGTSWENAYINLDDALYRAANSICSGPATIYVAQGTYAPQDTENGFVLPDGVAVYGGFPSGGGTLNQRNPKKYKTILTGLIDDDAFPDVDTVVTMGQDSLLDGFTVMYAGFSGSCIYGSGVDFTIENCIVTESYDFGIFAENGNVAIKRCTVNNNNATGIYHEGEGYELTVERSWVLRNGEYGVYCLKSTPNATNSIFSESGLVDRSRAGIRLYRPTYPPVLRNCTIANNNAEGVLFTDNANVYGDPNNLDYPDIRSCIVYYNNDNQNQLAGLNADSVARYCCIQDCNEVNYNYNDIPGFAYAVDPNGTPDPNNYHLSATAFCINMGDPAFNDETETDYDGETRLMGSFVDIGADEVNPDCQEASNELDLGADGIVNLVEFSRFSAAWLTYDPNHPLCDPNHPGYVSDPNDSDYITQSQKDNFDPWCDLVEDLHIDLSDLDVFVSDTPWLWRACWYYPVSTETMTAGMSSFNTVESAFSLNSTPLELLEAEETVLVDSESTAQALMEIILFVDDVIAESPDNVAGIEEMRAVLVGQLKAIVSKEEQFLDKTR